ncbi:MAG: carbohydrate kinase family protein [bacterium]
MKVGVIGTFNRDVIYPWQGARVESVGGLYFSVLYLANLLKSTYEILPIAFVGDDFYQKVVDELSEYRNINLSGIQRVAEENTLVTLTYTGSGERKEIISKPMPPLGIEQLRILENADVVILNLITGMDVDLAEMQEFRAANDAVIYMDFHSHALGIDEHGKRFYRRPDDWKEWVNLADVLQINEMEARTLAGYSAAAPNDRLIEFGRRLLQYNPSVCHITLADQGSFLFFIKDDSVVVQKNAGITVNEPVDAIGCGDAFAAAYLANYFKTHDEITATQFANKVAAMNCTFVGSSGIDKVRKLVF